VDALGQGTERDVGRYLEERESRPLTRRDEGIGDRVEMLADTDADRDRAGQADRLDPGSTPVFLSRAHL
jgi:hypothetical protein